MASVDDEGRIMAFSGGRELPIFGGSPQTVTDAETGWSVTVPHGTRTEYAMYALVREQILALQGRVAELEARVGYHLEDVDDGATGDGGGDDTAR